MPNPKSDSDVNVDGASRSLSGLSMVEPDASQSHSVMKDIVWPCCRNCPTPGALESHTRKAHSFSQPPRKKKHHGSTSTKSYKGGKKRGSKLRTVSNPGFKALVRSPIPEAASDTQTPDPKEELSNPRSEMVEPDVSESPRKKTYLCYLCSSFIESRSDYKEHIVSKHREESGMQKPSPCLFCNRVFESTLGCGIHMEKDHSKEIRDDQLASRRIWDNEIRRKRDNKNASQLHKAADQCVSESLPNEGPKQEIESDVVDADLETDHYSKPPLLNGLRHLTVDDLEKLELSDLAYIRFSSVPCSTNDRDIVPMEEIAALQATSVSYGSVIKTGQYAHCPDAREVIRCLTCGSRVIQDRALRDICLRGCPPGWACRSDIVGPYRPSEVSERYYKILSSG